MMILLSAPRKWTSKSNMSAWRMCVTHLNQWDQQCFEISWFGSENMVARYILIEKERKTYNNNNNISNCKNDNNNARRVMSLGLERTWNLRLTFSFHDIFWRIFLKIFFFFFMRRLFDKKINYIVLPPSFWYAAGKSVLAVPFSRKGSTSMLIVWEKRVALVWNCRHEVCACL